MKIMRVSILALLGALVSFISLDIFASSNDSLVDGLSHCTKISNDESRLLCFDKLSKNNVVFSTVAKVKNEQASQTKPVKLKESKRVDSFSKAHLKKTQKEKGPESINAIISKVKQLIRGEWVIYLENGQKWQQKGSGKIKLKKGDEVRLKKGSIGAVYLYKEGSNRSIRVKRLK